MNLSNKRYFRRCIELLLLPDTLYCCLNIFLGGTIYTLFKQFQRLLSAMGCEWIFRLLWLLLKDLLCRSSHQRCSIEKGVLRNFAKFTGKHLCQSLRPATLLKKRL